MNKLFFKADLVCDTPLTIGSGKSDYSDYDVLRDYSGNPFIPGTGYAGACRHYFESCNENVDDLFGSIDKGGSDSKIIFYEGYAVKVEKIMHRDGVQIEAESGTATDGSKFDYEVAERGSRFGFRVEIDHPDAKAYLEKIICGFNSGKILLGHRTSRGFGKVHLENCTIQNVTDLTTLLDFSWKKMGEYTPCDINEKSEDAFTYKVMLQSPLFISNSATLAEKDGKLVNSEQLLNGNNEAVIPGTSWAGIFRHYFMRVLRNIGKDTDYINDFIYEVFGMSVTKDKKNKASKVVFRESIIKDGVLISITRNAIDRFTSGACDKKLFTNRILCEGETILVIDIRTMENEEYKEVLKKLIELCVMELNDGFLNIGGMGSVGYGIVKLERV